MTAIHHQAHVEARIAHIADLMRGLKYRKGVTCKALAQEWDLSEQRIWELSAEASKRVRAEVTDPDRVGAKVCTVLERVLDDAVDDGDRKSAIDAAKQWAIISGAAAPQRVKHEGAIPVDLPADRGEKLRLLAQCLTREEIEAMLATKGAA